MSELFNEVCKTVERENAKILAADQMRAKYGHLIAVAKEVLQFLEDNEPCCHDATCDGTAETGCRLCDALTPMLGNALLSIERA